MAIGDFGNNANGGNQQNKTYEPSYYARVGYRNEKHKISVRYGSGLMVLTYTEFDGSDFRGNDLISIYLSPLKAQLLATEINNLLEYVNNEKKIDPKKAFGVNAGMSEKITYIAFHADTDKNIYCTIGKFDGNGKILESYTYQFEKDYHYSLQWDNVEANDLSRVYHNTAEISMLRQSLLDFARSSTGAFGYPVLDLNRYEVAKDRNDIGSIFDKLGIERRFKSGGYSSGGTNNFLNNTSASASTSLDDMENLLV